MSAYSDPANKFVAVTPHDDTDLTGCRGLYVGVTGNVLVRGHNSSTTVTFTAVPAGAVLPLAVSRVMAATTATDIVALY